MKTLLAIPVLLCCLSFSKEKKPGIPELNKYSYLAIHMSGNNAVGSSTGFFIKKKDDLFFVTTYHTCTCVDLTKKELMKPEWDKLYIRLSQENNNTIYYPIDLKILQSKRKVEHFVDHPDICLYKVEDIPATIKINTIDDIVNLKDKVEKAPDDVVFFGFPKENESQDVHNIVIKKTESTLKFPLEQAVEIPGVRALDDNIMALKNTTPVGGEGSPVFFEYYDKDHVLKHTLFGGMVFTSNDEQKCTYILKSKYILSVINGKMWTIKADDNTPE